MILYTQVLNLVLKNQNYTKQHKEEIHWNS